MDWIGFIDILVSKCESDRMLRYQTAKTNCLQNMSQEKQTSFNLSDKGFVNSSHFNASKNDFRK